MTEDVVILGIDPGLDLKKPAALALVAFPERRILWASGRRVTEHFLDRRIAQWVNELYYALLNVPHLLGVRVSMVAIEDARARGRGGASLQFLVSVLRQHAEYEKIRCELVNPSTVKLQATGSGKADTETVARYVRSEYKGTELLPLLEAGEYDPEMAVAIAGAGYAVLQGEALLEEAK
jgi:Holliday junction resolvasome RuvABC endonuclease subunit